MKLDMKIVRFVSIVMCLMTYRMGAMLPELVTEDDTLEQVKWIIAHTRSYCPTDPSIESPLMVACSHDELSENTRELLRQGARVDVCSDRSGTLIHVCISNNQTTKNLELLAQYAPAQGVNFARLIKISNGSGYTPLRMCLERGYMRHAQFLLEHGEDINGTYYNKPIITYPLKTWLTSPRQYRVDYVPSLLAVASLYNVSTQTLDAGLAFIKDFRTYPKYHDTKYYLKAAKSIAQAQTRLDSLGVPTLTK